MPELRQGENRCPSDGKLLFEVTEEGIRIKCHRCKDRNGKTILFRNSTIWQSLNETNETIEPQYS